MRIAVGSWATGVPVATEMLDAWFANAADRGEADDIARLEAPT
jgi:hypothetical protein